VNKKHNDFDDDTGLGTKSVWAGELGSSFMGVTQVPVVHGVTYAYDDLDTWHDVALGKKSGHIYSRNSNPTVDVFEEKIRVLEGAEAATSFSTGMAAISGTLFELMEPGERVVSVKDTYGGTSRIFIEFLPKYGVEVELCETLDEDQILEEIQKGCTVLYLETPTNPTLKILDIEKLTKAAKAMGAIVVVDNTVATPINQNPLELGADLVVHSATKFLGGHSDALGGVVCGKKELVERIFAYREINGATLHPMAAYLLLRGMKTLELRIERHNLNAMKLAQFLNSHPKIDEVFYPGLESHIKHEVAVKQMKGFGGLLSFSLKGDIEDVEIFLKKLKYVHMAAHLGAVGGLAGLPRTTSHVELTAEGRRKMGIPENLIRYSVGIENIKDIISDMKAALD
jgi:cystathionine gamma-synthase